MLQRAIANFFTMRRLVRWLDEKEQVEDQARPVNRGCFDYSAPADAILSLNGMGHIVSWNNGAEPSDMKVTQL
jgi:hypothetical protein